MFLTSGDIWDGLGNLIHFCSHCHFIAKDCRNWNCKYINGMLIFHFILPIHSFLYKSIQEYFALGVFDIASCVNNMVCRSRATNCFVDIFAELSQISP